MMKISIVFAFLFINGSFAFAQKTDTIAVHKSGKIRNVYGAAMTSSNDILTNISSSSGFTILTNVIKVSSLTDTFNGNIPITVFAPPNKAFEKFSPGKLDSLLLPAHKTELISLLTYHVIAGKITSKDIENQIKVNNGKAAFTTLSGSTLTARINENRNIILTDENGGQSVISVFDISQSNGIMHIVTALLIPKKK
jgi:uncharacterized surface protein with fasciclin (FAS1) repeats